MVGFLKIWTISGGRAKISGKKGTPVKMAQMSVRAKSRTDGNVRVFSSDLKTVSYATERGIERLFEVKTPEFG